MALHVLILTIMQKLRHYCLSTCYKSVFNKDKNSNYCNIFLEKDLYQSTTNNDNKQVLI